MFSHKFFSMLTRLLYIQFRIIIQVSHSLVLLFVFPLIIKTLASLFCMSRLASFFIIWSKRKEYEVGVRPKDEHSEIPPSARSIPARLFNQGQNWYINCYLWSLNGLLLISGLKWGGFLDLFIWEVEIISCILSEDDKWLKLFMLIETKVESHFFIYVFSFSLLYSFFFLSALFLLSFII